MLIVRKGFNKDIKEQKKINDVVPTKIIKTHSYTERDLHKVLTYYAYSYMKIYIKTIYHEKSRRRDKGANELLEENPDFKEFISDINACITSNRIYDTV